MSERVLRQGTTLHFGRPAEPLPAVWVDVIGQVVAQVPEIIEAFLPQCFIEGDADARQVLVVEVRSAAEIPGAMKVLMPKLALLLGEGKFIDVLPFAVGYVPEAARVEPCFSRPEARAARPWWKLW